MDGSSNLEGLIHSALEDVTRNLDKTEFNLRSLATRSIDGRSNLKELIHSALDDVTRYLDRTELNLKSLAENPYVNARSDPSPASMTDVPRASNLQDSTSAYVRIPHKCVLNHQEYTSRPKLGLDWILSTDPSKVQNAEPPTSVGSFKEIPQLEWILDTKRDPSHSQHRRPEPPLTTKPRPAKDLEWIISTNASQPTRTKIVHPEVNEQKGSSEWILKTNPEVHNHGNVDDPMHSLEESKRLSMEEENQIRSAKVASTPGFANPDVHKTEQEEFGINAVALESPNPQQLGQQPPLSPNPRPAKDLEWIISTNASQPTQTKIVHPEVNGQKGSSDWILRTNPEVHNHGNVDDPMHSLEESKRLSMEEENQIRSAKVASTPGFANPDVHKTEQEEFGINAVALESPNPQQLGQQPPLSPNPRPAKEMDWIFSTNASQPTQTKIVHPEVNGQKGSTDWILRTNPEVHNHGNVDDPMHSLEESKRLSMKEENQIRSAKVASTPGFANPDVHKTEQEEFGINAVALESPNPQQLGQQPPLSPNPRPAKDLEWIISTNASQPTQTKIVHPEVNGQKGSSDWILRTNPEVHNHGNVDDPMHSLEESKRLSMEEENQISSAKIGPTPRFDDLDVQKDLKTTSAQTEQQPAHRHDTLTTTIKPEVDRTAIENGSEPITAPQEVQKASSGSQEELKTAREPELSLVGPGASSQEELKTAREPEVSFVGPRASSQEELKTAREPELSLVGPGASSQEELKTAREPEVSFVGPRASSQEELKTAREPELSLVGPGASSQEELKTAREPEVSFVGPRASSQEELKTAREPELSLVGPGASSQEELKTAREPEVSFVGPRASSQEELKTAREPELSLVGPGASSKEELKTAREPELSLVGPGASSQEELKTAREPEVSFVGPRASSQEELKTAREPELSLVGPGASSQEELKTAREPDTKNVSSKQDLVENALKTAIETSAERADTFRKRRSSERTCKSPNFLGFDDEQIKSSEFISPKSVASAVAGKFEITPKYSSYFTLHRRFHPQTLNESERSAGHRSTKSERNIAHADSHRNARRVRSFQSDVSLQNAAKAVSYARIRLKNKAAYLKARRKKRSMSGHHRVDHKTEIKPTEDVIVDNHLIQLGPLRAPISIDSKRSVGQNGEQTNLRQVLRIYGSGHVEEPYDNLPRRTSTRYIRGAVASVKYGTNMIEIALHNSAIQSARRGQASNWIFTHARDVHTTPLVFGKTVLVNESSPAPFCLSVAAPFWVSVYQEQSKFNIPKGGERMRESIEVRSCKDSGIPLYEMKPLVNTSNPLFREHVYLGKGVIRIDRDLLVPVDQELREFYSNFVNNSLIRQYRVELPWRQMKNQLEHGIPRAPQITDIHTTVREDTTLRKHQKPYKDDADYKRLGRPRKKSRVRRRLPPQSSDLTGTTHLTSGETIERPDSWRTADWVSSGTTTPTMTMSASELRATESYIKNPDLPTSRNFIPRRNRMQKSRTAAASGVILSDRENSPAQLSEKEIFVGRRKKSDLPSWVSTKIGRQQQRSEKETLILGPPAKLSTARAAESLESRQAKTSEKKDTLHVDGTQKSENENENENSRALPKSPADFFNYSDVSERAKNEVVTAHAFTPVLLRVRKDKAKPLKKTKSVSYRFRTPSREKSRKSVSSKTSKKKRKPRSAASDAVVNAMADALERPPNDDIVIHQKLADDSMKLELHLSTKMKGANQNAGATQFQAHKITVQGENVYNQ
ncbi:hypothetical protein RB195_015832 [Necator americanus]|uniref:Uncharacterized protein n=1 Tax=Necator americanus TaxID=51031 RepID=A0ABR1E6D1_NECAM